MDFMIDQGTGQNLFALPVKKMDVSGVKVRGGDYVAGELERAVMRMRLTTLVLKSSRAGKDRKKWRVYGGY